MGSLVDGFRQWLENRPSLMGMPLWLVVPVGSIAMALISVAVSMVAVVRIPHDYFRGPKRPVLEAGQHPVLRVLFRIGRNLLGGGLIALGILLSVPGIPGQGLLTVLLGLMLVDFPGKRRLEQWLVRRPAVRKCIDTIRKRFNRRPLEFDDNLVEENDGHR